MPRHTDNISLSVMLIVPDAGAAAAWYKAALGAEELWSLGSVAGLRIGGAPFFLHDATSNPKEFSPRELGATTTRVELFVDDPDAMVASAAQAGATAAEAPVDHEAPWGNHRQGGFTDPFGHRWSVGDRAPLEPFPA